MGLESVELVLEIEDAFGIALSDEEASSCATIGDTVQLVSSKVSAHSGETCRTNRAFYKLRRELQNSHPISRREVRPATRIDDLIPAQQRRRVWENLNQAGLDLPKLELSKTVFNSLAILVVAPFLIGAVLIGSWWPFVGVIPLGTLAYILSRPWATSPLHAFSTVGGVSQYLAYNQLAPSNTPEWSRSEIAGKIRCIISEQLGIPMEELLDETRFVEDLGV